MYELAYIAIVLVLAYLVASSIKTQSPVAGTLSDVKAPVAEQGKEIPVIFGTRDIQDANVVWYGDLRTTPIYSDGGKK